MGLSHSYCSAPFYHEKGTFEHYSDKCHSKVSNRLCLESDIYGTDLLVGVQLTECPYTEDYYIFWKGGKEGYVAYTLADSSVVNVKQDDNNKQITSKLMDQCRGFLKDWLPSGLWGQITSHNHEEPYL